jgi:hypothetical protein
MHTGSSVLLGSSNFRGSATDMVSVSLDSRRLLMVGSIEWFCKQRTLIFLYRRRNLKSSNWLVK